MFEEFNTVDEKHEFEIVENGFILRVMVVDITTTG